MESFKKIESSKKRYTADGVVYGVIAGWGKGTSPARKIFDETLESLEHQIRQSLSDGSLATENKFEWLSSATMVINVYHTVTIDGMEYINKQSYCKSFSLDKAFAE